MYTFDPTRILEEALNKTTGRNVTLQDLHWPAELQKGTAALNALVAAAFVMYVVAISLVFASLVAALFAVITAGRLSACLDFLMATVALVGLGLASGLVTAVIVKASNAINKYGNDIGLEAYRGGRFLALTWAATALMLVAVLACIGEFCLVRRHRQRQTYAKHG